MVFRSFYLRLLVRIIILAANALVLGYFFFRPEFIFTSILLSVVFVIQVISLIIFLNRINAQLAVFVNYLQNEDPGVTFRENASLLGDKQLNKYFAHLADIVADYRSREKRWQTLLDYTIENLNAGILVIDENNRLQVVNKPARNLLGIGREKSLDDIALADPGLLFAVKTILPGQRKIYKLRQKDDLRQLLIKSANFRLFDENLRLVSMQDIRNELQNKEIESWQKLIRVITHEVNNTVSPVTSMASLLLEQLRKSGDSLSLSGDVEKELFKRTIEGLEIINERNEGLLRFVKEFRSTTLPPQIAPEHFSVGELVTHIATLFEHTLMQKSIALEVNTDPPSLTLFADKKLLSQVMINLVKNAVECFEEYDRENKEINISARSDHEDRVLIEVADNGPGIPENLVDKIFVPFFTTRESGSGIGLSFSRQVISKHHGSLEVFSEPGLGARFVVRI